MRPSALFSGPIEKTRRFLDGATVWKAAHAHWLGGDLAGADKIMEQYWQDRAKARDPLLVWRRANWLIRNRSAGPGR